MRGKHIRFLICERRVYSAITLPNSSWLILLDSMVDSTHQRLVLARRCSFM
jgi:hypothetical protein